MSEQKPSVDELEKIATEAGSDLLELLPAVMDDEEAMYSGNVPISGLVEKEILVALPESTWQVFSVLVKMISLKDSINSQDVPESQEILKKVNSVLGPFADYTLPVAVMSNIIQKSLVDFLSATVHQELIIQLSEAIAAGDMDKVKTITDKIKTYGKFLNKG